MWTSFDVQINTISVLPWNFDEIIRFQISFLNAETPLCKIMVKYF